MGFNLSRIRSESAVSIQSADSQVLQLQTRVTELEKHNNKFLEQQRLFEQEKDNLERRVRCVLAVFIYFCLIFCFRLHNFLYVRFHSSPRPYPFTLMFFSHPLNNRSLPHSLFHFSPTGYWKLNWMTINTSWKGLWKATYSFRMIWNRFEPSTMKIESDGEWRYLTFRTMLKSPKQSKGVLSLLQRPLKLLFPPVCHSLNPPHHTPHETTSFRRAFIVVLCGERLPPGTRSRMGSLLSMSSVSSTVRGLRLGKSISSQGQINRGPFRTTAFLHQQGKAFFCFLSFSFLVLVPCIVCVVTFFLSSHVIPLLLFPHRPFLYLLLQPRAGFSARGWGQITTMQVSWLWCLWLTYPFPALHAHCVVFILILVHNMSFADSLPRFPSQSFKRVYGMYFWNDTKVVPRYPVVSMKRPPDHLLHTQKPSIHRFSSGAN